MFEYHADKETVWAVSLSNGLRVVGTMSIDNELRPGIVTVTRPNDSLVEVSAAHIVAIEGV